MHMFDFNTLPMYFLGANAPGGFRSRFADNYDPTDGWRAWIIKGGPGTGKSSLMKRLAAAAAGAGKRVELSPCSSDPASLDAVLLPDEKKIILDGTAPHVVEPRYPGVCERIVNLGDCWRDDAFAGNEKKIIALCRENQALHARATRYLTAAGQLARESCQIALSCTDLEKAAQFAAGLAARLIPKRAGSPGREWERYLSGMTPQGLVFFRSTVEKTCGRVVVLCDPYGAARGAVLSVVREIALQRGQEIVTCRSLLLPDAVEHILIPGAGLAFCTEGRYTHLDPAGRRIHARRFTDMAALHEKRGRLSFHRRAQAELLQAAGEAVAAAKAVHDEIERYYIRAMDFAKVDAVAERLTTDFLA